MDISGLIILFLTFFVIIVMGIISAGAGPGAVIVLLAGFAILILLIIYAVIRYSAKIRPEPLIPTYDHPIPALGDTCEVLEEITPANVGWVLYRGELWQATSVRSTFKKGDIAYVIAVRGTILIIEREPPVRF